MLIRIRIIPLGSWTITSPNANTVWLDGTTNAVEWTVGREDVNIFDIELARLGAEGLKFVARNGEYLVLALRNLDSILFCPTSAHGSILAPRSVYAS